jgi:type II secretory ATPase GspE/PulE/Tfp pilus assembly ATPase PilB-like protein
VIIEPRKTSSGFLSGFTAPIRVVVPDDMVTLTADGEGRVENLANDASDGIQDAVDETDINFEVDSLSSTVVASTDSGPVAETSAKSFFGSASQAPVFIAPTPEPEPEKPTVVQPIIYREVIYASPDETAAEAPTRTDERVPKPVTFDQVSEGADDIDELGSVDHGPEFEIIEPVAKDPMFMWRGKPIGAKPADIPATPSKLVDLRAEKANPKTAKKAAASSNDGVDPRTWLGNMVQRALTSGASDVHVNLNGDKDTLLMRVRIDGQMQVFETLSGETAMKVMGIFKAGAEFASAGSFIPEEAIYAVDVEGEQRKARAVLFRSQDGGDALVMRLPPMGGIRRLDELEFSEQNLNLFKKLLLSANRMLLIAGPMGSGKTTTSHAALMHVATPDRSVWTVEDPVERFLPGMTQLEVDDANGAGFEKLLPSLVRADYDTLFLGEIRDKATAAAGVRQAKAGRQVISTIHSNDNVTAVLRLIELAEDTPLSVMDAVKGVVSQRLVRRLAKDWDGDPATKYKGRVPIHEVLMMSDDLVEAVMEQRPLSEIKKVAAAASASTFAEDGLRLIESGVTDAAEIARVLGE